MTSSKINCKIEHHATLFALLAKYAMTQNGEQGEEAIEKGVIQYGNERGARMAQNALRNGDDLTVMTFHAYGEWIPDYEGQMTVGQLHLQPTLWTYVSNCAWCEAWKKHGLLEYGKYYCPEIDNAVYQGFRNDFSCRHITTPLSWGGYKCIFNWKIPLTEEENLLLAKKKQELGTYCTKDFTYHTAHILHTISRVLEEGLGEDGKRAVRSALEEYVSIFGQEYLDILNNNERSL